MAEVGYWEQQLVRKYVLKAKQARYLSLLKGPKHRRKFLDGLNHAFDFDPKWATVIGASVRTDTGLLGLLRARYVADTCYLIADGTESDGRELRLELGVRELLSNHWGTVLICPPVPVAVYKSEDPGQVVLLERRAT